jgi:hypothetical protein
MPWKPASKKTITFADTIATPLVYQASETSLVALDVLGEGAWIQGKDAASTASLGDFADDDESFASAVDSVEEEERSRTPYLSGTRWAYNSF